MLEISKGIIKFTKGDTVAFDVELKNADDTFYEMQKGDKLTFTLKSISTANDYGFKINTSTTKFVIPPSSTNILEPGKYCYDISLNTADGNVYTIVGIRTQNDCNLIVYPEVEVNVE